MRKKAARPAPTPDVYAAISDADFAGRGVPRALIPALRAAVTTGELEAFLACLRVETATAITELAVSRLPAPREAVKKTVAARTAPPPRPPLPPAAGGAADVALDDFYLPTRVVEWAAGEGITTLRELARISPAELRAKKGMGELSIRRTRAFIEERLGARWESLCAAKTAEASPPTAPLPATATVDDGAPPAVLDLALDTLGLPVRMVQWVQRKGLSTLRELVALSPEALLDEKKMGRLTIHRTRLLIEPRLGCSWEAAAGAPAPARPRRAVIAVAPPPRVERPAPVGAPPPLPPAPGRQLNIYEELVRILRERGSPMMRGELVGELLRLTSASARALDKALHRAPFMRLEPNCYGLTDRDLPGRAKAAAKAADHVAALLAQRGSGLGAGPLHAALTGLSPTHARWTREMCLTALRGDPRLVQSAAGAVGLATWRGVRLPPREEVARECLRGRGRVLLSTLKQRMEEIYGEPPTQRQIWAVASRLGASVSGGWLKRHKAEADRAG
jgi:hypothetical protein